MGKSQNIFVTLLDLLGVNYTESFSDKYFNEHAHKNNLYGLSKMLSDYGIPNAATKIEDKEKDIFKIKCPFVAHAGSDFSVVYQVDSEKVHFLRNGNKLSVPVDQFIQSWSGIILLAEASSESGEPDYKAHRKKEMVVIAKKTILFSIGMLVLGATYYIASLFSDLGITALLATNLAGVYVCFLLVSQQMRIRSRYVDKICTLFSQSDCNNVLESDAAKLFGILGWSEIGLGYFAANVFILLFLPNILPYLVIINIIALPYTIWSVWYQKVKARQWCPLCLAVQALLWIVFLWNVLFGYIRLPEFDFHDILLAGCLYAVPILALTLLVFKFGERIQIEQLQQEINSIKTNDKVFNALLTQQPVYEVSISDSQILFGNPNAKLIITIFSNPFCGPCARMHERINKLITRKGESHTSTIETNACIQYIFSAFNEYLEYANRYFIAVYLEKGSKAAWQLYSDWFEKGKTLKEEFFNDLQLDMTNSAIEIEFQKHESWKDKTQLRATPTIIINGHKLPDSYKIEDLRHFTEFDVNIKYSIP